MRSNYRRIGDFIELIDIRNDDLAVDTLLGLSISKQFIPSVANTVGTNMKRYKIIKKNQFACSIMQVRRDKKMPVAILKDFDEAIISQAYPVFEVIDENELLPDYLMMWFSRAEFDRQATFWAVGGVRGSLEWEDFLNFEFPKPDIEEQRAIVAEYQTVTDRVQLNEQINAKLEETAQALYRHWFIDFEFPDKNGKPYKSSGGKMVWNEELEKEVPEEWEVDSIKRIYKFQYGKGNNNPDNGGIYPIYGSNGCIGSYDKFNNIESPVIGHIGINCGAVVFAFGKHFVTYNGVMCFCELKNSKWFSYCTLKSIDLMSQTRGSSQPFVSYDMLYDNKVVIPEIGLIEEYDKNCRPIYLRVKENINLNVKLKVLTETQLSNMATVHQIQPIKTGSI